MKKIRLLVLIISIFMLSGCSVEYNLIIDKNTMEEDINAIFSKTYETEFANEMEKIRRSSYYNFDTRENEYYKFKKLEDKNNIILNYNYIYTDNNLYKSEAFSRCYYNRIVNVTDRYITINTDKQVACLYKDGEKEIEDITVNVKTDLKVLDNNADKVNDNTYTWYITDKNFKNKSLYIKMEKDSKQKSFSKDTFFVILIVISIILIGLYIFLKAFKKHNKSNQIK